ncbi:hypothetical protein Tco_1295174 [Tanacetum coccineum]
MVGNDNNSEFSMKYPPGFIPNEGTDAASMHMEGGKNDNVENLNNCNMEEANVIFSGNRSTMNSKDDGADSVFDKIFSGGGGAW